MNWFIQRHASSVRGVLNGFDRLRLRGTKRLLAHVGGMRHFLWQQGVLLKDFKSYVMETTDRIRRTTERLADAAGRPRLYLASSSTKKEDVARGIAKRDGIREGLICVLSSVEPCRSYDLHRNRATRELDLRIGWRKCLHYYYYLMHPLLGFMHVRLQTWFPLMVHLCLNGREWLARQMDAAGIGYVRRGNCFVQIADVAAAQALMDRQLRTHWPRLLDGLVRQVHPSDANIFRDTPVDYYWSVDQSEWASDVMFRSTGMLAGLYPRLIRHGMEHLGSMEVMRFLGHKVPAHNGRYGTFKGEVISDLLQRPEGVRIKHRVSGNSIKMYDKHGSVLRVETTINEARCLKVYRPKEGDPNGPKRWRYLRKGIADLHRRAQVSQAANHRYFDAMAAVDDPRCTLGMLAEAVCRPVRWKTQRVRALNPLSPDDAALLAAVSRGEFTINGFRNRDLRTLLDDGPDGSPDVARRRSAAVTRKIRLLRAHGLIHKVPSANRYKVSPRGRTAITAFLAARAATPSKLTDAA